MATKSKKVVVEVEAEEVALPTMSGGLQFKLDFRNKNIAVVFNAVTGAKWYGVNEPFASEALVRAIGHVLAGTYKMFEPGLYLKAGSWDELRDNMGDENAGYVRGDRLIKLVEDGIVSRFKEVNPKATYRVVYDGIRTISAICLTFVPRTDDEYESVKHDRNAIQLVDHFEYLRKAQTHGVNLSMIMPDRSAESYNRIHEMWKLFNAGKLEDLKALHAEGATKGRMLSTIKHYETIAKRADAKGESFVARADGFEIRTKDGEVLQAEELIGRTIQFAQGSMTLRATKKVTLENVESVIGMLKSGNMCVVFASPELLGRNAMLPA